ncbi:hypothetical protein GCM10023238_40570 [Streptomyces heliomycini]
MSLRFFEDVLDWIKTLAKEDPDSHLHVIAAWNGSRKWARRSATDGRRDRESRYRNMRGVTSTRRGTVSIRMLFVFDPERGRSSWWRATRPPGADGRPGTPGDQRGDDKFTAYLDAAGAEKKEGRANEAWLMDDLTADITPEKRERIDAIKRR